MVNQDEQGTKPVVIRGESLDGSEDLTLALSSEQLREAVAEYIVRHGLIPIAACKNVRLVVRSGYTMVSVEEVEPCCYGMVREGNQHDDDCEVGGIKTGEGSRR